MKIQLSNSQISTAQLGYISVSGLNMTIFCADIALALGVALGVCYAASLWAAYRWRDRGLIHFAFLLSVLLCSLGYLFSPEGSLYWIVATNRLLSLLLITGTTFFVLRQLDAEQALAEQSHRNAQLVISLEKNNQSLRHKNRQLEQFSYMASHDFQEPLKAICRDNKRSLEHLKESKDADVKHWLHSSYSAAKAMQKLIHELLEYAQIEPQTPQERLDLNALLTEAKQQLAADIDTKQVRIQSDTLPVVVGNRAQLQRLLHNLLANAVQYGQAAEPEIYINHVAHSPSEWQICIADNGKGVAAEDQQQIFEPFVRLHNAARHSGSGIGLATCKKILDAHNGKIWIESDGKTGSRFCFTLTAADRTSKTLSS